MTIYNFNGRPFCLRRDNLIQREQRIFELLVKDYDERIVYPYELEAANGNLATRWRHLTADEVQTLLDENDERPLPQRLVWSDQYCQIDGTTATVTRIAPMAHFILSCTLLDQGLQIVPFDIYLPIEDFVSLMLRIKDNPSYGMKDLNNLHPVTYQRIMNKCPQPVSDTGHIILTTAHEILAQSKGFGEAGDEISLKQDDNGDLCHVVASIDEKHVEFYEETAIDFDINPVAEITVADVQALCRALGVSTADDLLLALETVFKGSDGTLAPIKAFLNDQGIPFTVKVYE